MANNYLIEPLIILKPGICPKCKKEREFRKDEIDIMKKICERYGEEIDLKNAKTYDAVGCELCNQSGYYDRVGLFEVLDISDEIKEMIMQGKSSIEIRKKALEQKYRPLVVDGIHKVLNGITNLNEINRKLLIVNQ